MQPIVSYIVNSYNYADYVTKTIESVLSQDFDGLELIVVDDCSTDHSWDLIQTYSDPRLMAIRNNINIGANASYEKAFRIARGQYIGNLDSDDWIEPSKTTKQAAALDRDEALMVVGTWVHVVDERGESHPRDTDIEGLWNTDLDLNRIESWCVHNRLCRSSTMIRRSFHEIHGLYDHDMARAPDFEVWTRALRAGAGIGLIREPLTNLRFHGRGVTHADPVGNLIEVVYLLSRNIVPLVDPEHDPTKIDAVIRWPLAHPAFARCPPDHRYKLVAALLGLRSFQTFAAFRDWLSVDEGVTPETRVGATALRLMQPSEEILELRHRAEELWRVRNEWFLPRIEILESELKKCGDAYAAVEQAKQEWFLPRIAFLEAEVAHRNEVISGLQNNGQTISVKGGSP